MNELVVVLCIQPTHHFTACIPFDSHSNRWLICCLPLRDATGYHNCNADGRVNAKEFIMRWRSPTMALSWSVMISVLYAHIIYANDTWESYRKHSTEMRRRFFFVGLKIAQRIKSIVLRLIERSSQRIFRRFYDSIWWWQSACSNRCNGFMANRNGKCDFHHFRN